MKFWTSWQGDKVAGDRRLATGRGVVFSRMSRLYSIIRPLLFRLDAERAHSLTLTLLHWAGDSSTASGLLGSVFAVSDPRLEVEVFGIRFKNPVGLAAGYDKNGIAVKGLSALGFGHIEVGTVTRRPQAGNPRPRIHRVPGAQALINSMGFPNAGVDALPRPLAHSPGETIRRERGKQSPPRIGINIGRSKDTPPELAAEDYCLLLKQVHAQADYVAINVSSPNTPGLRQLQARAALEDLLRAVTSVRDGLTPRVPLLVKIAPDLTEAEIDDVLSAVKTFGVDGIIATNTTLRRDGLPQCTSGIAGGVSGAPLRARATEVIRYIARRTEGRLPVVGVGGIANPVDALEKLRAGARLVQVYTGLVYAGLGLAREINLGLLRACEAEGARNVRELGCALV